MVTSVVVVVGSVVDGVVDGVVVWDEAGVEVRVMGALARCPRCPAPIRPGRR